MDHLDPQPGFRPLPVPLGLRVRRTVRRFPPVRALRICWAVWRHPSNRVRRVRAVVRAVAWQARSRLRSEPVDVRIEGGLHLRCHPRSNAASNVVYFTARHDPAEMAIAEAVVRPGDLVVDVGANIGTWTLFLVTCASPGGSVVAVEPAPLAAGRLRENVSLNALDMVEVVEAAVGAEAGRATMDVSSDVSNSLSPSPGSGEAIEVAIVTLDGLLAGRRPSFVKIDVEGFEDAVLAGAPSVMAQRPTLLLELSDHLLHRSGASAAQLLQRLEAAGYEVFRPVLDRTGGADVEPVADTDGDGNIVAVPAESVTAFRSSLAAAKARRSDHRSRAAKARPSTEDASTMLSS